MEYEERLTQALADRYRIEREIGSGGMATVYLAQDLRHERQVAVKVFNPELAATLGAERFLREIKTAAKLAHPHILPVHDSGEADGFLFYVMPYVKGESLRSRLTKEKQLPVEDAVQITREIADALAYAHREGVIHRDVKPANIMLEEGHAVLADFGVAHAVAEAKDERITRTGTSLGTPAYMSPEQATGERDLDGRSDQYALGCVLYEMLTGDPPFTGAQVESVVRQHLTAEPPEIIQLRPAVPEGVSEALKKSLAKAPADRFKTTAEFGMVLAMQLQTPPGGAVAPEARRRSSGRRSLVRSALIAGAVVAVLGMVAIGYSAFSRGEGSNPQGPEPVSYTVPQDHKPSIAVLPFRNRSGLEDDAYFTDGIHDEILTRLSKIRGLSVRGRTSVMSYRDSPKNLTLIGQELNARYILEGGVLRAGDEVRINVQLEDAETDTHVWAESLDREMSAANLLEVQSEIAERIASALRVELTPEERDRIASRSTENIEAYESYLSAKEFYARVGSNERDLRLALQLMERAVNLDPDFAPAYARLCVIHSALWWFFYDRTLHRLQLAKQAVDRAFELDPGLPEAQMALGWYYYWGELDYDRALQAFSKAVEAQPGDVDVFRGIAAVLRRQGKFEDALDVYQLATELDPRNPNVPLNHGYTFLLLRRFSEAAQAFARADLLTPGDPTVYTYQIRTFISSDGDTDRARGVQRAAEAAGVLHNRLGFTLVWLAVLDGSLNEAMERLSALPWDAHESQLEFIPKQLYYAQVHGLRGEHRLERLYYDSARVILEAKVREDRDDSRFHSSLGIAYAGLGRFDEAVREGERAVQLLPIGREAWRGMMRLNDLTQIYTMVGQYDKAIDNLEFLLSIPGTLTAPLLRLDPIWDPLRSHPRFQALLER